MSLWDATIEENILVVCKTPMARCITRRTLAGFRDISVNAQHFPNLIQNITARPEYVDYEAQSVFLANLMQERHAGRASSAEVARGKTDACALG